MNSLQILLGNSTEKLFEYSIKSIAQFKDNLSFDNIIIVPDKLSLYAEQSIFNALNIDVYFNIYVMGISKFASMIIEQNNLESSQCTALESKLFVLKAVQNVCKDFKCFSKKYTLGFIDEIFAKIEQIKSSNCDINELIDDNALKGTKLKFEDIKLIYNEYEKLLSGKLDSGALLSLFNQTCGESEYLKKCNVFFVGFDSLTRQGLEVLKNVARLANYAQISVVSPYNQNNFHIYDQTFLDSIIDIATDEKIECEIKRLELKFKNDTKNIVLNNLFSRKKSFCGQDFYKVCKTTSKAEEIELCVKQINYMLKCNNLRFDDFAICSNPDYHKYLINQLKDLNIDVYCDEKYRLFDLEPIKYLYYIISYVIKKDDDYLKNVLSNDFCELSKEEKNKFLTILTKYGSLNNMLKFYKIENENILNYINILKTYSKITYSNYLELFEIIIKNSKIYEKIALKCKIFEKNDDILLNKVYLQIEDKLTNVAKILKNIISFEKISQDDFLNILQKVLSETEISSVPSTTNQLFIGDSKSFYFGKKYLFVLGLNEGSLPIILNDYGLISDKEISSKTIKAKLEPTTKLINKRNKFKLFEILLSPMENCFMFYHGLDADNKIAVKSDFVSEFEFLFNIKEITSPQLKLINCGEKLNVKKVCYNLQDCYNANLNLRENNGKKLQGIINFALLKNNKLFYKPKQQKKEVNFSKLFFVNNKASISIIEKYNGCPKSSFLANCLKLQQLKKNVVEANVIGTFIHEVGEKFVKQNTTFLGNMTESQIVKCVNDILKEIQNKEQYYSIMLPENSFLLNLLKEEAQRFCLFINQEQSLSEFKPKYAEKYFGKNSDFKPIEICIGDETYTISGVVDRIDVYDDYFRIIDYKTGSVTNSKGAEQLFYGTKVQLFVYAKAIEKNINKKLFGAFYLPIKNGFSKDGNDYAFSGFFEDSPKLIMMCDKNISLTNPKSNLLNLTIAKVGADGEIKIRKKHNILAPEVLQAYLRYSVEVVKKSIIDASNGFVECSPIKDKCEICEFNKICKNAFNAKIERQENFDVTKEKFVELCDGKRTD